MANLTYSVTIFADSDRLTATVTGDDREAVSQAVRDWAVATYSPTQPARPETMPVAVPAEATSTEEAPICAVHDKPMVLQQGKRGPFWSCHERNTDGRFCSYRPPRE